MWTDETGGQLVPPLSQRISQAVASAPQLYHRLVLVVGPALSGKTVALRHLHDKHSWPLLNMNLLLSERLLDLTARRRALRVARIVDDIVDEQDADPVILDNIEMLFHPDLKQDPLRLLQSLSRKRTVVATWRGDLQGSSLTYASPDHPEYRRFEDPEALIVQASSNLPARHATASAQGPSA